MKFGLISSKYFAMVEFSDANQSCKYFDEVKKASILRYFYIIFLMRVNFNIMLNSAIKSDAFISYKKSGFYKMKNLKKRKLLRFCLSLLPQKCAFFF